MPEKKNQYIDVHCHILPEVDDGARNLEESLAMLRQEVKQGAAAVILTPHQKPNRRSITAASALERTQKLQQAAKENGIDIRLYSGGEIFCCMDTIELLKQGKAGTLAGSDYILTEFSPDEEWAYIRNCLYDLLCEGYRPIVAHTERYRNVVKDFNRVEELKDMGCRIQINAGELPGLLGGQLKRTARSLIKEEEDTVVCVLGEHESQSGEAASRAFLTLPEEQQVLFEKIAERTSNIVTVVIAGRPLDLRRISEKSKAVIMAWRPGTMGAEAIVDIVYGRINPSGKLSVSIPWCVGQVPISYWDVKTGHILTEDNSENRFTSRYMDIPNTPLYPFGYGLSYTEFDISDIDVQIGQDKKVHVHCNVCNIGNVAGAEVVQCYYETLYASVVRPKKELIRFRKVFLEPGEKKDVDFFIDQEEFSYYGKNMEIVSSGMKLRISVGNSSDHLVFENIRI